MNETYCETCGEELTPEDRRAAKESGGGILAKAFEMCAECLYEALETEEEFDLY